MGAAGRGVALRWRRRTPRLCDGDEPFEAFAAAECMRAEAASEHTTIQHLANLYVTTSLGVDEPVDLLQEIGWQPRQMSRRVALAALSGASAPSALNPLSAAAWVDRRSGEAVCMTIHTSGRARPADRSEHAGRWDAHGAHAH